MNTHSLVTKTLLVIFMLVLSILLTACGGGGSSDNSGDDTSDIRYVGLTQMAIIDEGNAVELALGAYFAGPFEDSFWAEQHSEDQANPFTQSRSIVPVSETVFGECGGSIEATINIDDQNGDFTGTEVFKDYCEDGMTTSGTVNFTGNANLNTVEINYITMSFEQLTVSSVEGSVLMSGTINNQFGLGSLQQTMDYLIRDNVSYKVYKIENYIIDTVILPIGTVEITYTSGNYYHPDFGYVELESMAPFIVYDGGYGADSGELLVKGHALTKALLSVLNSEEIRIEADTNGDGVYNWSTLE